MNMRLTPIKETALHAMKHGPLQLGPEGWTSTVGIQGTWNTHSITWLADRKLVITYDHPESGTRRAKLRPAGVAVLAELEHAA